MPLTKIKSLGITDGTIVNADINASAGITLAKLTGVNDAKAWVNFNGTGTVAIRGSFNVTSITDNGTGDYTVNFTTAMTDINYCINGTSGIANTIVAGTLPAIPSSTSSIQVRVYNIASGVYADSALINITIFR